MKSILLITAIILFSDSSLGQSPKYLKGGVVTFNLNEVPSSLNPLEERGANANILFELLFEGLLRVHPETLELIPALAESYEYSKDQKSLIFKIRNKAKWHDGKLVTAEDVKFSFDIIFSNKYGTLALQERYKNVKDVQVLDKQTVKFNFHKVFFLNIYSIGLVENLRIIPKHIYSNEDNVKKVRNRPVGSGAYYVKNFDPAAGKILLWRNRVYWGFQYEDTKNLYNFDQITFLNIKDSKKLLEAGKEGRIDLLPLSFSEFKMLKPGKNSELISFQDRTLKNTELIVFNLTDPRLSSIEVRKALALAFDQKKILTKLGGGREPLAGPVSSNSLYFNQNLKPLRFSMELASEVLQKEGWKDSDGDGVLDKKIKGKKYSMKLSLVDWDKNSIEALKIYANDLKKIGIELNLELVNWKQMTKKFQSSKFDLLRFEFKSSGVDWLPLVPWHSGVEGGGTQFNLKSKKINGLIEKSYLINSRKKRIELLNELQVEIVKRFPAIFIGFDPNLYFLKARNLKSTHTKNNFRLGIENFWIEE